MTIYYTLLLLMHTLLLVWWLGLDLGIFYLGACLARRELPAFTRATLCRIIVTLDMVPRFCLILILPVGVQLSLSGGYTAFAEQWNLPIIAGTWLLCLGWTLLTWLAFRRPHRPDLTNYDRLVRLVVIGFVLAAALASALGGGPIDRHAGWLDTKLVIYAAIVGADMMIRTAFRPLRVEFAGLAKGSIPAAMEAQIVTHLRRAKPWVLITWAGLVIEAYLGLSKLY